MCVRRAVHGVHVTLSPQLPSIPRCPKFFNVGAEEPLTQATMHSIIHMGSSPEGADPLSISVAIRRPSASPTLHMKRSKPPVSVHAAS
jgi:hypothetical protein